MNTLDIFDNMIDYLKKKYMQLCNIQIYNRIAGGISVILKGKCLDDGKTPALPLDPLQNFSWVIKICLQSLKNNWMVTLLYHPTIYSNLQPLKLRELCIYTNVFAYVHVCLVYMEGILFFKLRTSNPKINSYYLNDLNNYKIKTILNFGSGDGYTSYFLRQNGFIITDVDIKNYSKTETEPIIYDGKKLPFFDNTFDCIICNFVLHHTEYDLIPDLISEMKRVGNIILISEDLNTNFMDKTMCKLHLVIKNHWNSSKNVRALNNEEWMNIFDNLNLKILKIYTINRLFSLIYPINRVIYILK